MKVVFIFEVILISGPSLYLGLSSFLDRLHFLVILINLLVRHHFLGQNLARDLSMPSKVVLLPQTISGDTADSKLQHRQKQIHRVDNTTATVLCAAMVRKLPYMKV